ncbi:MAG: hypothetical protein FWF29_08710 [Treponema sp.]|nr:hypothetical protein [Treponema sp.]
MNEQQKNIPDNFKRKYPSHLSSEMAKRLTIADWGTPEEVEKMADVGQIKNNIPVIRGILEKLIGKKQTSKTGDQATLSKSSIDEILWRGTVGKSKDVDSHLLAASNIEKLYPNAIKKWDFKLDPNKKNKGLKDRKYLFSPMKYKDDIIPVKFTIKDFENPDEGNRLYSLQTLEHQIKKGNAVFIGPETIETSTEANSPPHSLEYRDSNYQQRDGNHFTRSQIARNPDTPNIPQPNSAVNENKPSLLKKMEEMRRRRPGLYGK